MFHAVAQARSHARLVSPVRLAAVGNLLFPSGQAGDLGHGGAGVVLVNHKVLCFVHPLYESILSF